MSQDDIVTERTAITAFGEGPPELAPTLLVLAGGRAGQVFKLGEGFTTLGRASDCEIELVEAGVSRHHARLEKTGLEVVLVDLGSTNGTYVGGKAILRHRLSEGDRIVLGSGAILRFGYQDPMEHHLSEELYLGATRDRLTGVANRAYLFKRLEQETASVARQDSGLVMALLDIDHFKKVNDTYGHPAGDAALTFVAQGLDEAFRTEDLVARFGGEEFAVLLRNTDATKAAGRLDQVREKVAATSVSVPTPEGRQEIHLSFSAGVAQWSTGMAVDQLVEAADTLLYRAKHEGRNRVVF